MPKHPIFPKNDNAAIKAQFGAIVRNLRRRLGVSQEELAWQAGIHRTYLADIERGQRNLSLSSIVRLVRVLGVSLSEFFSAFEKNLHPLIDPPTDRPEEAVRSKPHKRTKSESRSGRRPLQASRVQTAPSD